MSSASPVERSRSPPQLNSSVQILCGAHTNLRAHCTAKHIPEHHGYDHALRVLKHAELALASSSMQLVPKVELAVQLAALLHDADDRKYVKDCPKGTYPNAKRIMEESGTDSAVMEDALRMISLVSCSVNGNSAPPDTLERPELLWPRWADRLEATGEIGVVRCWQVNNDFGDPASCDDTPRPQTEDELWALATPERFAQYQASGGGSKSMMDHYYDKLLQVSRPPAELLKNRYLTDTMEQGARPLVDVCMEYSRTGEVPIDLLKAMESRTQSSVPAATAA